MNKKLQILTGLLALSVGFTACQKSDSGTTHLQIRMTDAPGNYDEINLSVKEIVVKGDDSGSKDYTLESGKKFNILDFREGTATPDILVADNEVPSGTIKEIRLVLNETGNTIKVDGIDHDLIIPSGYSSGWKVKLTEDPNMTSGMAYTLLLDFDAAKSIVLTGSGKYLLKPVVRGIAKATSGIVKGTISPGTVQAKVYAIDAANDSIGAVSDATTGIYSLGGLKAGTYKISIVPQDITYNNAEINSVAITAGETTELGTTELVKK